jgi:NAD(P)-dependent dehydrogenase (short-subunit alcohol dehydrogenase family)
LLGRIILYDRVESGDRRWQELLVSLDRSALFSLEGKTAVLTGASGFLGRTFAETLLTNGARAIVIGRSEKLEAQTAIWAERFGAHRVRAMRVDMYDLDAFGKGLERIAAEEERIDILINNAHELGPNTGFNVPDGGLDEGSYDQWMRNLTGGVYWPALTVQKLGKRMQAAKSGSIVNISTMYAVVAPSPQLYAGTTFMNPPGYSASKAALMSFTRYIASFWGAHGIRANAILPGPFSNTEDAGPNAVKSDDFFLERLKARTCLGRIGRPQELAGALLFLASDASSYITGQGVIVDGGWTVT